MHDYYSFVFLSDLLIWFRLIFIAMGVVRCNGFDHAALNPSDRKGHEMYCIVAIKDKKMGFIHA